MINALRINKLGKSFSVSDSDNETSSSQSNLLSLLTEMF